MAMALEGIKIIDLTRLGPGPYCTMLLADMGADVIKIEAGGGRAAQTIEAMDADVEERRRAFNAEGRNKRSIVLNLKMDEAREVFFKLIKDADVVIEEFRPGVLKRLGIDYDTISKINPRGGPPVMTFNLIGDYSGGSMQAALGITTALIARERTGRGQHVDVSMTDGIVSLMHGEAAGYFDTGRIPTPGDLLVIGGAPFYGVYETKDGKYISIGALEPWFYANLCELLGREDLLPYEWDITKWDDISSEFRQIFRTKTRDEWVELLRQKDVCVAPVYTVDEVFDDPQVAHRKMLVEIDHPTLGKVKQVGIGIKFSDTPGAVKSIAPKPGQHTDDIMLSLDYTKESIAELRQSGAIA